MPTPYCQNVLKLELAKADYNGMTADAAWAWLMTPATTTTAVPTNARLTPILAASVLGPAKAEAIAHKTAQQLPTIAAALMSVGVNLSDPATAAFLDALVDGTSVTAADVAALKALGSTTLATAVPRRFDQRFDPAAWPHVAADGSLGSPGDPAIHQFPNSLDRSDFDAAWSAAGRS